MNLAAILPRFPQVGFQPPQARPQGPPAVAPAEPRTMLRHAVMTLENRALQLRVLCGWVWITREGCIADLVLGAGDVFEQRPGTRVLVQALEEAELSFAGAGVRAHNARVTGF
ncbi:MAG: DUF2917 domain-containing protein [Rubrivivax sp.]